MEKDVKQKIPLFQNLDGDPDITGWTLPLNNDSGSSQVKDIIKFRGLRAITTLIKNILRNETSEHAHLLWVKDTIIFTPKSIADIILHILHKVFADKKPEVRLEGVCLICGRPIIHSLRYLERFVQSFIDCVRFLIYFATFYLFSQ